MAQNTVVRQGIPIWLIYLTFSTSERGYRYDHKGSPENREFAHHFIQLTEAHKT